MGLGRCFIYASKSQGFEYIGLSAWAVTVGLLALYLVSHTKRKYTALYFQTHIILWTHFMCGILLYPLFFMTIKIRSCFLFHSSVLLGNLYFMQSNLNWLMTIINIHLSVARPLWIQSYPGDIMKRIMLTIFLLTFTFSSILSAAKSFFTTYNIITVYYYINLGLLLICYFITLRRLKKMNFTLTKNHRKLHKKMFRLVSLFLFIDICICLPGTTLAFFRKTINNDIELTYYLFGTVAFIHSIIDPMLYMFVSKTVRSILCCKRYKKKNQIQPNVRFRWMTLQTRWYTH